MIQNHAGFERALEEAASLLAEHPAEGTPGHERLFGLMRDIAAYRPAIVVKDPAPPSETERLARHLDRFESSLPPHISTHWHSMIGGDLSGKE